MSKHLNIKKIFAAFLIFIVTTALVLFLVLKNENNQKKTIVLVKSDSTASRKDSSFIHKKPKPITKLSIKELWTYYLINPCYLPLVNDSNLWEKNKFYGFKYEDLFNEVLAKDHPYSNRYLVGDFNVLDEKGNVLGVEESYPKLTSLHEFNLLPPALVERMDTTKHGTKDYQILIHDIRQTLKDSADLYINFLEKVWKYKMLPIRRMYSVNDEKLFAAGQKIVLCEACGDTLLEIGKFAVSAKRQDFGRYTDKEGNTHKYFKEYLPIGKRRKYYAGKNRISMKNWETERKYEKYDYSHDQDLGGGSSHVTYYEGRVQLPNFLLIEPALGYERAMRHNGIHEVALRELARGMLGTANSIGCIRVTDFGSKFIRWWTPQNCNFFIAYDDARYHKKIDYTGTITDYLPFKTPAEGQSFRKWINTFRPEEAKRLEISDSGDYKNGFILDAYFALEKEYKSYLLKNKSK